MANGNGNGRTWAQIGAAFTIFAIWTGAVMAFGMHIGDGSIHTPMETKVAMAKEAAKEEVDHLKELLLQRLDSIDGRLEKLENGGE